MQTLLPYPFYARSAAVLDAKRLPNQLKECVQIHTAITDPTYGWQYHPCIAMWRPYPAALVVYGCACYREYQARYHSGQRGGSLTHASGERLVTLFLSLDANSYVEPSWLGDERLHSSHRACLLAKNYTWYSQFGWTETPTPPDSNGKWPYYWPL
jgi:hypothetical protein